MKVGISERMSPCEALWAESGGPSYLRLHRGMEGAWMTAPGKNAYREEQEEEDEELVAPKPKRRAKVRRLTQAPAT